MSNTQQHSATGEATSATGLGAAPLSPVVPLSERLTLSVSDVAQLCGVSRATVYRWIGRGLPVIPHMHEQRISRAHLNHFLGEVAA